ncbi:MerR family transcriptional regulator [Citroniella saccharovorans]|uniref:MerR family transcriptional regulator n=1 Tax=Citroniella saccharovorans TaxID=2053367 RepID=A0AAW9MQT6_9FIRM|nr:MerR family transcriptional regulator [Citroniella saccharovorans]MEB3429484.1 MerR family transcriptional regulator [Citroniella saccharovorans]
MKKEYTIGEISNLYNLSPDALRHYEKKGLLNPKRKENGYRFYDLNDIWKLNIIKDMKKLDFTLKQIKDYLENRSLDNSIDLLKSEISVIEDELEPLLRQKKFMNRRLKSLRELKRIKDFEEVNYKFLEERKIITVKGEFETDQEIDLAFRELERRDDESLTMFASKDMGTIVSKEGMRIGEYDDYQNAFFLVEEKDTYYDAILPRGFYATLYYKGSYNKLSSLYQKVIEDINYKGLEVIYPALEIYRLDIHSEKYEENYITEIQVRVKEKDI